MKCVGLKPTTNNHIGGVKVYIVINVDERNPKMVWFTDASTYDYDFWDKLQPKESTVYVFDKGSNDHKVMVLLH